MDGVEGDHTRASGSVGDGFVGVVGFVGVLLAPGDVGVGVGAVGLVGSVGDGLVGVVGFVGNFVVHDDPPTSDPPVDVGGLIGHDVQSWGHVEQLSVPLHTPSPHDMVD